MVCFVFERNDFVFQTYHLENGKDCHLPLNLIGCNFADMLYLIIKKKPGLFLIGVLIYAWICVKITNLLIE